MNLFKKLFKKKSKEEILWEQIDKEEPHVGRILSCLIRCWEDGDNLTEGSSGFEYDQGKFKIRVCYYPPSEYSSGEDYVCIISKQTYDSIYAEYASAGLLLRYVKEGKESLMTQLIHQELKGYFKL